ncbi:hypothetical protein KK137_06380 [Croceibacterium sp. LX-88]|uniref:SHOCT domain-containing protein n=1 Tax=Croceibacterium selenioxidans TaxID=2838833 RepID=A0ABS5W2H5_9SPHN|nr:SHOCT domain-containing protein [Croceibacterium selenioxidans]MBT2133956.1 hypothetical protein [Croceibacterium selenioxidans]
MGVLIWIIIIGGIGWMIVNGIQKGKAKAALRDSFMAQYKGWDVYVSSYENSVIAVDQTARRIALGTMESPIQVAWEQIASVEIERNGQSLSQTNRGSQVMGAAVGGLLLGPAGLLLGGLTGSKRNVQLVNELSLKVVIDDHTMPVHRVSFFKITGNGLKPDNALIKPLADRLEHFHALISNAIRAEERARQVVSEAPALPNNTPAQIEQLWGLRQSGALTDDEFTAAKARLLAAPNALPG